MFLIECSMSQAKRIESKITILNIMKQNKGLWGDIQAEPEKCCINYVAKNGWLMYEIKRTTEKEVRTMKPTGNG